MASAGGRLQAYEKTSVELSYPSAVRFTRPVQLKGGGGGPGELVLRLQGHPELPGSPAFGLRAALLPLSAGSLAAVERGYASSRPGNPAMVPLCHSAG